MRASRGVKSLNAKTANITDKIPMIIPCHHLCIMCEIQPPNTPPKNGPITHIYLANKYGDIHYNDCGQETAENRCPAFDGFAPGNIFGNRCYFMVLREYPVQDFE